MTPSSFLRAGIALIAGAWPCVVATQTPAAPAFARDVAPILNAQCVSCHHQGGDAPFSLETYDEVRRRARQIAEVTTSGYMPPWKAAADSPSFLGERRLTAAQIATLRRWVDEGAPGGEPRPGVPATRAADWPLGPPDAIVALPSYTLQADGGDVFRNFVVRVPFDGARYVAAMQFRPRSTAVHHANIRIDRTPASRRLDEADPAPGYEGLILHSAEYPDGHFLGWTPGQISRRADDLAWRIEGGSDLVVQLHMRPSGRPEMIAPVLGLYFTQQAPARTPAILRLGRQNLDIPGGAERHDVTDSFVLPVDAEVVAMQPHAHFRAREVLASATLPDGSRRTLIHISDWDFNWQDQYRLAAPFWLPAGTTLDMRITFDNSAGNPRNPSRPPERVGWGWRSSDEMGDVWIQLFARDEPARQRLAQLARRKAAVEDAVGAEVVIAREPDYADIRNDAALIYMELEQPERALTHFAAVTRLRPESPAARYNEGVALEAMNRGDDAAARYRAALDLDASYLPAKTGLASQRCRLARTLTENRRPADAVREYRAALALQPETPACLINFAWLLAAHADAGIRRPTEAIALAERAAALNGVSRDTQDVLAAAYSSAGRFADAVRVLENFLDRAGRTPENRPLEDRLALYRRRIPFIVED